MGDTKRFIVDGIKESCSNYKNRLAGSHSERECQKDFARKLKKFTKSVRYERFRLSPRAFMGWLPILNAVGIVCISLYFIAFYTQVPAVAYVGTGLITLGAIVWMLEFVLYRRFIDFLFPSAESANVYAKVPPKGKVKRRIVFCGHADAAYEMTYVREAGGKLLYPIALTAIIGLFFVIGCSLSLSINLTSDIPTSPAFAYIQLAFVPAFVAMLRFINFSVVVDGANDNLSGCYVAMGVLKELKARGVEFEHTEVACLITGGEESGLRGSLEFAKKHKDELTEVETIVIATDTLKEIDKLAVYSRGQNWTQKNCDKVASLIKSAGNTMGIKLKDAGFFTGATDAEAFSRYGLKACALCGVDHSPKPYYHTRHDTHESIDEQCLEVSLEICIKAAQIYDEKGIA